MSVYLEIKTLRGVCEHRLIAELLALYNQLCPIFSMSVFNENTFAYNPSRLNVNNALMEFGFPVD